MYRPDVGLLTSEPKNDVGSNPHIIAPDPFASDDCLDVFSPDQQLLLTRFEDVYTMNTGEDESTSGLNGRLRPRKSTAPSPQTNKIVRKSDGKSAQERPKRTSTPSKASSTKPDDLSNKSDLSTALQLLCPYCDRKFASKQAVSKHVRRIHFSSSKHNSVFGCLFCKHNVPDSNDVIRHMVDSHPNQYFACLDCHTRFASTSELAEHKLNVCEKQKMSYRNKLRQKASSGAKKNQKTLNIDDKGNKGCIDSNRFNGIVISCELKPSQTSDTADIEDNITTNLILPPNKNLGTNAEIEKNAVIVLDDLQWSKRMPANFSFHNTDADQILSRLGVVHRSPRTSEFTKKDWLKNIDESTQKFEKCFDTGFYSKVASNVQENLTKFLDGSFNFNPDADSTIKTRKLKNSVVINTAEGFPILLACEQFSRTTFDGYIPRTIAPKHKWKWDNEKNPMNPDDIKRDTHVNNCIITLVSSLDIWTQLCMRRKFEDKFSITPLEKKTEKQNTIGKELKEILESREIPSTSSHMIKCASKPIPSGESVDFPASLGLKPATTTYDLQPAVLSGEWVRPRCYVCCACGAQTRDSRGLSSHITTHHPNAQVQYYEIAGELLLNADILKHLYVPPSILNNRTRPLRGFRECTKCKKSISLEDLHQHMLDCAGDTPTVRRKCRYRPFGVRRRRPRLPDNTIRKKIRKDMRRQTRQTRQKSLMRPRPKIRTEVGDAESIRKMIADLPAKRHRAIVTPVNPTLRPRKKMDQQRNKLILKRRTTDIAKTRKQQAGSRNTNERLRSGPSNEDNDDKSIKDDDDKPLKPRIKRLVTNTTRKSETLKRKVALNRAKRRAQLKEQTVAAEEGEPKITEQPLADTAGEAGTSAEQLSIGNTPQRIDVNSSSYNTRDHSSRHRSSNNKNNNDQQAPSNSEHNGDLNNAFVPTPNEPLKHSIARLTSDMEMYDKSLQFHHQMFLLQQECNEINRHVTAGQQRLFENEAVVTKLDKPPLHFQQRGMLDSIAFQRNKLNKPRKGLNDCIAMLKNKLVDPIIPTSSSHSVECGSDDPLQFQPAIASRRFSSAEYEMQVNTRPAEIFSRHNFIPDRLYQMHNESSMIHQGFSDIPLHFLSTQNLYEVPARRGNKIEKVKAPRQKQSAPKRGSTRRRSARVEKDNEPKDKIVFSPHRESIPQQALENHAAKVSPPCRLDSVPSQNLTNDPNKDKNKSKSNEPTILSPVSRKEIHELQEVETVRSPLEILTRSSSNEARLFEIKQSKSITPPQKQAEACTESQLKQLDAYKQCQKKELDTYTQTRVKHSETYVQSQPKQKETYKQSQKKQTEAFSQSHRKQTEAYTQSQLKQTDAYTSSQLKQKETYTQSQLKQTEAYTSSQLKQPEAYSPSQLKQTETYPQSQLKHAEAYKQSQSNQAEAYTPSQLKQTEAYPQSQLKHAEAYTPSQVKQTEAYTQPQPNQAESYIQSRTPKQNPSTVYAESTYHKNMAEVFPEREVPRIIITHDVYSESNFNPPVPLVRRNSNSSSLEPVLPIPLDLSLNLTDNSETSTKQNSSYQSNDYDSYETLDLSNKSVEFIRDDLVADTVVDGVVDLRVKSSQISQKDVELSTKSVEMESATDLTIKTLEVENIPTDLTVRKKSAAYRYHHIDIDYDCVQDLSKHRKSNCDEQPQILSIPEDVINQEIPTDLSGKKVKESLVVTPISTKMTKSPSNFNDGLNNEEITSIGPANLSVRKEVKNQNNEQKTDEAFIAAENAEIEIDVERSQDSYDINEAQSYVIKRPEHFKDVELQPCGNDVPHHMSEQRYINLLSEPNMTLNRNDSQIPSVHKTAEAVNSEKVSPPPNTKESTKPQCDDLCKGKNESDLHRESDSTLPLYTLSNTTSKYESTMPVYTLANACITMSKIEPSSVASNLQPTFSISETTVAKNLPSLTDTLVRSKTYSPEHSLQDTSSTLKNVSERSSGSETSIKTSSAISKVLTTESSTVTSLDQTPIKERLTNVDIDPETAKKIALLPKELVEILGTMPVDHRNQLLNVLPNYVSKSPSAVQQKETSVVPETICTTVETSTLPSQKNISSHFICSEQTQNNEEIKPLPRFQVTNETATVQYDRYNSFNPPVPEDQNRIIDLTEDDPPVESKVKKMSDEYNNILTVATEPPVLKQNKSKVNDQTASLRAVRIKTPSERNKSMTMENQLLKVNVEQQIKNNVQTVQDLPVAVEKLTDLDKTMAIQQAEVSSTQHNTTSSGKYPLAISPASTESSSDEASKNIPQTIPITAVNIEMEKTKEPLYNIPLPKSKVSSSVSTKERNGFHVEPVVDKDCQNSPAAVDSPVTVSSKDREPLLSSTNKVHEMSSAESANETTVTGFVPEPAKPPSKQEYNTLDQDDSEDDISLAAIVKQKQTELKKNDDVISTLRVVNKKKRNRKTKKSERKMAQSISDGHCSSDDIVAVQSKAPSLINTENNEVSLLLTDQNDHKNVEVTKEESQPEPKKQHRPEDSLDRTKKEVDLLSVRSTFNDITSITKNEEMSENRITEDIDQDDKKDALNKCIENVNKVDIISDIVRKKPRGKKNLSLNTTEKKKADLNISSVSDIPKKENNKLKQRKIKERNLKELVSAVPKKDKQVSSIQNEEKPNSETSDNTLNLVTTSVAPSMSDLVDNRPGNNTPDISKSSVCNVVVDESDKGTTVYEKKVKAVEIHTTSQDEILIQETHSKDNLITTPLRRSRRGKSLFIESHSIEKEIMNTSETVIEHKTPLTKKQLIFSKLLLDEGRPEQEARLNIDKIDRDGFEDVENETVPDAEVVDVSKITKDDNLGNILDKSKATKRRISPNTTRKSKKKKSIEDCRSNTNSDSQSNNSLAVPVDSVPNIKLSSPGDGPVLLIDKEEDKNIVNINSNISDETILDKSLEIEDKCKNDQKLSTSSEKRKSDNQLPSDLTPSPKAKKCKTTKSEKNYDNVTIDDKESSTNEIVKTEDFVESTVSAPRTACYNIAVPARRGRSKSVVVKSSSTDLYDPYDIDLEDMIEQHESFRRKKKGTEQKSVISQKKTKISTLSTKDTSQTHTEKESTDEVENITAKETSVLSDSDDSSKSDVPLQKYVEEKEKKNLELEVTTTQKRNVNEKIKDRKIDGTLDTKCTEPSPDSASSVTENEAEQKLRSEQFMESFGFFSERKPRKSNLLATKKISETFHITNESDDMYFGFKERSTKKGIHNDKDIKKSVDNELPKLPQPSTSKKAPKRGRKKKSCTKILPSYCSVCKKEFRRPDNYLRHQMTLLHISKLSEVEMKVKTAPVHEEPNYLMAYKQYLERFKKLTDKLSKLKRRNPKAASKIILPTMQEILLDVNRAVREQQLTQRGLSHDEELFIDCCELLKESHNGDKVNTSDVKSSMSGLDNLENAINASFSNDYESDDDVDSITAQNILDSEEVRNLENDLISGLKEAAKATRESCNIDYQSSIGKHATEPENHNDMYLSNNENHSRFEIAEFDIPEKPRSSKVKKHCSSTEFIQIKEKMYPDIIEEIDMFEDKFDKIKRKCRSQAAAAKQTPPIMESCTSHRGRRKSEKKKGKKNSKKTRHQSTQVPTKGALKGFDGIKVSIPTSDINLSAIVPVAESSPKKKKKTSSKKKRGMKDLDSGSKLDHDHRGKDGMMGQTRKLDVYEFMDNEDAELFEFRPSTLMERFKSISNKETPNTSKLTSTVEDNSSESGSDGDDFVYMSDDYVCSDDETENSLQSCENGNVKLGIDIKKTVTPQKRKDAVEKNAVMGKIFKHNAVRTEKKIIAPKESVKPKANLDQLFDSLLEEDPSTSMLNSELDSPGKDEELPLKKQTDAASEYESDLENDCDGSDDDKSTSRTPRVSPDKTVHVIASTSKKRKSSTSKDYPKDPQKHETLPKSYASEPIFKSSIPKKHESIASSVDFGPNTLKKYDTPKEKDLINVSPKGLDTVSLDEDKEMPYKQCETKLPKHDEATTSKHDEIIASYDDSKSCTKKLDESACSSYDYGADAHDQTVFDEAGVARQRARRKCTVGKQNVLAESWSSESEPDGGPQRPNSAESVIGASGRKKKGRKKDGQQSGGRRGINRQVTFKRHDTECRVNSSNRSTTSNVSGGGHSGPVDDGERPGPSGLCSPAAVPSTSAAAAAAAAAASAAMPAPSTTQGPAAAGQKGRPRSVAYYWSSEGDDEQEHQQQHGWIVGDSHKKLVTMLAHAKGRKRNNDEKHLVE